MAINANFLSFIAGGAEQFTKNKDEFKKELRENKRRQRDWMNTYGNKVLNESKQKEEAVTSALKDLESRGLSQPDVLQLMQRHGVDAVLDLKKYVTEYEDKNGTRVDADLMNKVWKAADDFTLTSDNYGDAVSKVFGTNKAGATAPVIQEAEERSFFDKIKANLSGAYEDEEYSDFLDDPTEGIGNQSINDLRRMAAASPSMLGTEGAAVFDRSVLRGSEPSANETRTWPLIQERLVENMLQKLSEEQRRAIEMRDTDSGETKRDVQDIFNDLEREHKNVFEDVTRQESELIGGNRAAEYAYGGADRLNAILNPPKPLTPEKKAEELKQDLIDNNLTGARPEDIGEKTDVEIGEWFEQNNKNFVIANGQLVGRPDEAPFDESKVVTPVEAEATEAEAAQTERLKTAENIVPPKRPELSGTTGSQEYNKSIKERSKFDDANAGKYELDGTPILAPMYPNSDAEAKLLVEPPWNFNVKSSERKEDIQKDGGFLAKPSDYIKNLKDKTLEDFQDEWNKRYKETHDPLTGFPLGAKFTENAEAAE